MIVTVIIDASAVSAFLLKEEGWKEIGKLLVRGTSATELVVTESCNAILTALRRSRITEQEAKDLVDTLLSFVNTNIKIVQHEGILLDAFKLAKENDLTIYDTIYISLAIKMSASLASRDSRQIEVAKRARVKLAGV